MPWSSSSASSATDTSCHLDRRPPTTFFPTRLQVRTRIGRVEPEDFVSEAEFAELSEADQASYMIRFMASLGPVLAKTGEEELTLDYIQHYFNLMEWALPPEEFDRLVKSRLWDEMWNSADLMRGVFERVRDDPSASVEERLEATERLAALDAVAQHKADIDRLP